MLSMIGLTNPHPATSDITTRCAAIPTRPAPVQRRTADGMNIMKIAVALFSSEHAHRCCNPSVTPCRILFLSRLPNRILMYGTMTPALAPGKGNGNMMNGPDSFSGWWEWLWNIVMNTRWKIGIRPQFQIISRRHHPWLIASRERYYSRSRQFLLS